MKKENITDSLCIQKSADLAYEKHSLKMVAHRQYLLLLSISILTTINFMTSSIFLYSLFLLFVTLFTLFINLQKTKMRDFSVLADLSIFLVYIRAFLFYIYLLINMLINFIYFVNYRFYFH